MSAFAAAGNRNQPANKSWELSLYELHRQPQPAITDNTGTCHVVLRDGTWCCVM